MMHLAINCVGVLIAAIVSGATGLAFPLIATPIFLVDYAPPQAILITSLCSLAFVQGFAAECLVSRPRFRRFGSLCPGLDKTKQRAILQPYIIAVQCASLLVLLYNGIFTATVW